MDVTTLLAAVLVNALLMSLALVVSVGLRVRSGLQAWQYALLCQAGGFAFLIGSAFVAPRWLATLGVMTLSVSASAMTLTVCRFLSRAPARRWLVAIPLVLGAVHVFIYDDQPHAIALTNLTLAVQMLWSAALLLRGAGRVRWRWLVGLAAGANSVLVLGRVVLVLGFPEAYPRFAAPHPLNIGHLLVLNASLVLGSMGFLLAHRDEAEQALVRLASLDPLTGLLNRREWMNRASRALGAVRASDLVGRYGGEEFCLLLRHCDTEAFGRLDARLHQALRRRCEAALGFVADFSAGAVRVQPGETLAAAIQRADDQLYRAKHAGRGRTLCADGVL